MMKMIDMGKKMDNEKCIAESPSGSGEKNKLSYPSFSLYDIVPDSLFKKDIGDEVELKLVCKLTRKAINENTDKSNKDLAFDILKLGIIDDEKELGDEIKKQLTER